MARLRIGILTYHFSDNFGALLQAYGLKTWLKKQGHDAEFINYHPDHVEDGGSFVRLLDPRNARANAKILYLKLSSLKRQLFGNKAQAGAFEDFRTQELGVRGARMRSKADVDTFLGARSVPYDVIVCGSDQIWSPSQQRGLDPVYFADLETGSRTRRVSYAPSFGQAMVDGAYHEELRGLLGGLDSISVRERSGAELVERLTGRPVTRVPDPTILLGDFAEMIATAEQTPRGHVFCYALRSGRGIREVAELAGAQFGAEVLSPYNVHRRWREIGRTVHPSPKGWVAMVDRARFVVTNSFHGTVFSILLRRPFLVVGLPGKRSSLDERSLNLLRETGLERRFVENGDLQTARSRLNEDLDWSAVDPKVACLQEAGRAFLRPELKETAGP
jgi:hypothetical protein